jgi:anti-sigma B factor antagonist
MFGSPRVATRNNWAEVRGGAVAGLQVSKEQIEGVEVVSASGEIDISTAQRLRDLLDAVPDGEKRVIADLSGVTFLDSTGLGVLIATHKRLAGAGGVLELVITARPVLKVLEVTGLTSLFTVHESLAGAFAR